MVNFNTRDGYGLFFTFALLHKPQAVALLHLEDAAYFQGLSL
jgi:hypothetical protein